MMLTANTDAIKPITKENVMSDYNEELSELHQRVVEDVLGLRATIDDMGWIEFKDSALGEWTINLREYNPEYMKLWGVVFKENKNTRAYEYLLRACNRANKELDSSQELARLQVSDDQHVVRAFDVVIASVALVVAEPRQMPDEAFLRTVVVRAMSSIKGCGERIRGPTAEDRWCAAVMSV